MGPKKFSGMIAEEIYITIMAKMVSYKHSLMIIKAASISTSILEEEAKVLAIRSKKERITTVPSIKHLKRIKNLNLSMMP
jgi:hypothetical protein